MQKLAIPISIIIAGALIAGAVFFIGGSESPSAPQRAGSDANAPAQEIAGVQEDDHILGNPNADIVIVEYSDTECPFCKNYHNTMHRIIDEYGTEGRVAWIYRHFPLTQIHPKAVKEAEATECAAELGGNDAFWAYTDRLFEITPSNNGLDLDQLPVIAEEVGLNRAEFESCLESGEMSERVQEDFREVTAAGGRGTPHSVVLIDGEQIPLQGAQSYDVLKGMIDAVLAE